MKMKFGGGLLLLAVSVALAEPPVAIRHVTLDENVVVTVPVATNRVTTISFPGPISASEAAGVTADGKPRDSSNRRTRRVRRFCPCARWLYAAQDALVQGDQTISLGLGQLYKALGGGSESAPDPASQEAIQPFAPGS